jgi:ketosteroid isomerase-like protein
VKRCPTCHKTFSEEHLIYCVDDGTPLVPDEPLDEATVVRPSPDAPVSTAEPNAGTPAYQPPGAYRPPDYAGAEKRSNWPWAIGVLLVVMVLGGMAVAAAVFIPRMLRAAKNASSHPSANVNRNGNSNWNSNSGNSNSENWNENSNANVDETTPPPTDQGQVLSDLRDLEDEWTVANINADKKKLNRILADDYVGVTNGRAQGKAEYLKTIERDTSIQHWEFEDLKLTLNGDRAALAGTIKLDVRNQAGQEQEMVFRFTDKFVWRDARWQAIASEVNPLAEKPNTQN